MVISFRAHVGWCLSDVPTESTNIYPEVLPGQIYSAADQCNLNFDMEIQPCRIGTVKTEKLFSE
jgi:hypothetical protein